MNYLTPILKKVKSGINKVPDFIDFEIHKKEDLIKKWITDRWKLGLTPDGDIIGIYRSEDYADIKYSLSNSAGFGNVDLTLTGALGRGIKVSGFNNEYEIFSSDQKYEDITEKYGYANFNITDNQREELFKILFDIVLNQILQQSYE